MRKVQLGWLHFDDEKQSIVSVRTAKGGGTQEVDIKLTADKDDIIDIAKTIFFNDGNSNFGPEQLMTFGLANFQHEDISTITVSGMRSILILYKKALQHPSTVNFRQSVALIKHLLIDQGYNSKSLKIFLSQGFSSF